MVYIGWIYRVGVYGDSGLVIFFDIFGNKVMYYSYLEFNSFYIDYDIIFVVFFFWIFFLCLKF